MSSSTPLIERVEGDAMPVNSYLVHGPNGIVVVDGQLTIPDADKVRTAIDATSRPVAALVITHPHPDHYAAAGHILRGLDVPIVSTARVDAVIRRDDAEKDRIVDPMMGDAWPAHRQFPDTIVDDGATIELGGLSLTVHDLGPAESHADAIWLLDENTVFAGDVVYNNAHAYLADGHAESWVETIRRLERELDPAAVLYPGHGAPGGTQLLTVQAAYVERFRELVGEAAALGFDVDRARRHVVDGLSGHVSDSRLTFLLELSVEPCLAAHRGAA